MPDSADPTVVSTQTPAATQGDGGAAAAEPRPAVAFKSEGEYLASVEARSKGMINKAVTKAVDATRAEILGALGVESVEELAGVKERLATTEKQVSEAEKLKAAHDRANRDLEKERKRSGELTTRLHGIAKRDALTPFIGQVVDAEVFTMLLDPHLEVDDEGSVHVKDGRALENVVEDLLKKREYLKRPAAREGAGTAATEPRARATEAARAATPAADPATTANGTTNGETKFKTVGAKWMADLKIPAPTKPGP